MTSRKYVGKERYWLLLYRMILDSMDSVAVSQWILALLGLLANQMGSLHMPFLELLAYNFF
jgi:hypothetical protein